MIKHAYLETNQTREKHTGVQIQAGVLELRLVWVRLRSMVVSAQFRDQISRVVCSIHGQRFRDNQQRLGERCYCKLLASALFSTITEENYR